VVHAARDDRDLGARVSLTGAWRWKAVLTEANAQPALGFYAWDEAAEAYLPFALNVLSLRDGLVSDVTAFIVRAIGAPDPEAYQRFPEEPMNPRQVNIAFERFALPDRLEIA
jgi:RNA polymerase sigma-70 factor, ECF subfamily